MFGFFRKKEKHVDLLDFSDFLNLPRLVQILIVCDRPGGLTTPEIAKEIDIDRRYATKLVRIYKELFTIAGPPRHKRFQTHWKRFFAALGYPTDPPKKERRKVTKTVILKKVEEKPKYRYNLQNPEIRARALAKAAETRKRKKLEKMEADEVIAKLERPTPTTAAVPITGMKSFHATSQKTTNLALAAALVVKGHKLKEIKVHNQVATFVFDTDDTFLIDGANYHAKTLQVDAATLHETIRELRTKIASLQR